MDVIGTIRRVAATAAALGAVAGMIAGAGNEAIARQAGGAAPPRGLPDAPTLAPPPAAPGLGPSSPGALEPSAFAPQDAVVIGGKARGGSGRVPRRLVKAAVVPAGTGPRDGGTLALPPALAEEAASGASEPGMASALGLALEDTGQPGGLTLDEALAKTLAANLDLLALKYEVPQADADILTAGLRANPLIYADAQLIPYGKYSSTRPVGPTEYDIVITHPLDISHKRRSRVEVARAAKSTVEAQLQDAARRQVGNLYRAFVDLQAARLDVLTGERSVTDQERVVGRARRRAGAQSEDARLRANLDKARDSLAEARNALDDAREAIALLMGLSPDEASRLDPSGGLRDLAPAPPPLDDLTNLALATRPDLIAARRGIHRAESEVKLARANRQDDVFLFYDPFSYQDNRISHQPSGRSWAIGLTVPLPIYNRNQGNIARARSNVMQTHVEQAALERRITSEVRLAEREYRTSRAALDRAERTTLPNARRARAQADADFASGAITLVDYLDHLDDGTDAARTYRDALIRHRRSMLDLNTAVGVRLLP